MHQGSRRARARSVKVLSQELLPALEDAVPLALVWGALAFCSCLLLAARQAAGSARQGSGDFPS